MVTGSFPGVESGRGVTLTPHTLLVPRSKNKVELYLLSFNRIQSRVVTGLLTGHNTLRRHLHLMRLTDCPLCRKCGADDETSAHILCQCEALASLRHAYLGSFFSEPEEITSISLGTIWRFSKAAGLPWVVIWSTKGPFLRLRCIGVVGPRNHVSINQSCTSTLPKGLRGL
jgi:hypothetical protein